VLVTEVPMFLLFYSTIVKTCCEVLFWFTWSLCDSAHSNICCEFVTTAYCRIVSLYYGGPITTLAKYHFVLWCQRCQPFNVLLCFSYCL